MGISPEIIEEIKGRLDLVDVVSGYVSLRRAGRNFIGLCPFHKEKTPSFSVNPERQFFHCFGCKASGDLISFLMKIENLSFSEAVEVLAERAGVEIPKDSPQEGKHEGIREAYGITAEYYQERLFSKEGKAALEYLLKRGIAKEWAESFGIGYAPAEVSGLISHLEKKGFDRRNLVDWGLLGRRDDGSLYPWFRHRLMIPIHDEKGRVIAFGGRAIEEHQEPKYLNSPETPIFQKGRTLFAYHLAKKVAREKGVVLVEGYMDVIACHIHGFNQAIAALGTAFTPIQARKVERLSKEVSLLFDSDEAGWKATVRTGEVFIEHGIVPKVVMIPKGEDPDSFLRTYGREAFEEALKNGRDFILTVFDNRAKEYNLSNAQQRSLYAKEMAAILGKIKDPVVQDSYFLELSKRTEISKEVLKEAATQNERPSRQNRRREARKGLHWEEMLLGTIFVKPSLWFEVKEELEPSLFQIEAMREAVETIERYASPQMAMPALKDEAKERVTKAMMEIPPGEEESILKGCMDRLRARRLKREVAEVKEALSASEDLETRRALSERYMVLMRDLKRSIRRGDDAHEEL